MAVCIRHSFYKKSFSDQDVLGEKKGEKIAYSHQLHTDYKSGSKFFESLRYLLKYMSKKYSSDFFSNPDWDMHAQEEFLFPWHENEIQFFLLVFFHIRQI